MTEAKGTPALKVLLMAYECSPYRGSEWAVGWGRMLQASRVADVFVITSESNFAALTKARGERLVPANVQFRTPEPDETLRRMERTAGMFAYNYTAYHHWQKLALPLAERMHAEIGFSLVHQVNVCTFREPGYTWQLPIPYMWGPVGGSQNFPMRFLSMLPLVEAFKELGRAASNWVSLRWKPRVRRAARAAALIVGANSTNQRDYAAVFGRPVQRLLETGLHAVEEPDRARFVERAAALRDGGAAAPLQILWSGELQTRKALPLLLRALATMRDVPYELRVLGDGPMRALWTAEARSLGIAGQVEFLGRLPFVEAVAQMHRADLFCFTSMRDTSGNVILEALAAGVPVVCFDHQGAGDMVSDASGVRLPVIAPRRAVRDLAATIRALAMDGERLLRLSEGATAQARTFLWDKNGDWVNARYRELAGMDAAERVRDETMDA